MWVQYMADQSFAHDQFDPTVDYMKFSAILHGAHQYVWVTGNIIIYEVEIVKSIRSLVWPEHDRHSIEVLLHLLHDAITSIKK